MKTLIVSALLVSATALFALAPTASAIICTTDGSTCIGGGVCQIDNDPCPGVCEDGRQVVGSACTVDVPRDPLPGVCVNGNDFIGPRCDVDVDTSPDLSVLPFVESCGEHGYALNVLGAKGPCFHALP